MPLGCNGLHDWSAVFQNLEGTYMQECLSCGRTQRYYISNIHYLPYEDEFFQMHQQGYLSYSEYWWYGN
jgi:hypothetical protein